MAISKHASRLSKYYKLVVASYSTVRLLIQKQKFYEWASLNSYSVPMTWNCNNLPTDISENFPLVFKPEFRRVSANNIHSLAMRNHLNQHRFTIIRDTREIELFLLSTETLSSISSHKNILLV